MGHENLFKWYPKIDHLRLPISVPW